MTVSVRSFATVIATAAVGAAIASGGILFYPVELSASNIWMEVAHVRYACGDCYVQNRVIQISGNDGKLTSQRSFENENLSPTRYIGWDVLVQFKGNTDALSQFLEEHYDASGTCVEPTFRLKGQLKRKLIYSLLYRGDKYDGTFFEAHEATAIYRASPSCKQPAGDIPLQ